MNELEMERLTTSVHPKWVGLDTQLTWSLAHCTHTLLYVETRMSSAFDGVDHSFQACEAIQADIPYPTDISQISDCTREESVPCDGLNGYN